MNQTFDMSANNFHGYFTAISVTIEKLIKNGADVNVRSKYFETPLLGAVLRGDFKIYCLYYFQ